MYSRSLTNSEAAEDGRIKRMISESAIVGEPSHCDIGLLFGQVAYTFAEQKEEGLRLCPQGGVAHSPNEGEARVSELKSRNTIFISRRSQLHKSTIMAAEQRKLLGTIPTPISCHSPWPITEKLLTLNPSAFRAAHGRYPLFFPKHRGDARR